MISKVPPDLVCMASFSSAKAEMRTLHHAY